MNEDQEVILYLVFTFTFGFITQAIASGLSASNSYWFLFITLVAAIPGVFALVFIIYYRDLPIASNFKNWILPPKYYLLIFIPFLLLPINYFITGSSLNWEIVILLPLFFTWAFLEEFGWRGYLQRRVIDRYSLFKIGLFVGLVWSLYHLPDYLVNLSGMSLFLYFDFILISIGLSFVMIYLQIRTRSLPIITLLHTMHSLVNSLISPEELGSLLSFNFALAHLIYGVTVFILGFVFILLLSDQEREEIL